MVAEVSGAGCSGALCRASRVERGASSVHLPLLALGGPAASAHTTSSLRGERYNLPLAVEAPRTTQNARRTPAVRWILAAPRRICVAEEGARGQRSNLGQGSNDTNPWPYHHRNEHAQTPLKAQSRALVGNWGGEALSAAGNSAFSGGGRYQLELAYARGQKLCGDVVATGISRARVRTRIFKALSRFLFRFSRLSCWPEAATAAAAGLDMSTSRRLRYW